MEATGIWDLQLNQENPNLHSHMLAIHQLVTHSSVPTRLGPSAKGLVLIVLLQSPILILQQHRNEASKSTVRKGGNSLETALMPQEKSQPVFLSPAKEVVLSSTKGSYQLRFLKT